MKRGKHEMPRQRRFKPARERKAPKQEREMPAQEREIPEQRSEAPAKRRVPKQKRARNPVPGFYKGLLVFFVLMLAVIAVGAYFFWGYIEAYELSLTEHVVSQISENIDYDFWEKEVKDSLTPLLTEFERDNAQAALEPHMSLVREARYTLRQRRDESTGAEQVYILRAGARDIGIIRLRPVQDMGYGFTRWGVYSIEYLSSFSDGFDRSITITASQNAEVSINGIPVSDDYSIPCGTEYGKTYRIDNLFGEADIAVTQWDGSAAALEYAENGEYIYTVIRPFSRYFNIVAPGGTEVFINGEKIAADSITESRITPPIFSGYLDPMDVSPYSVRYELTLEGLYDEPEITAADTQGRELFREVSDDGQISYSLGFSEEYKELYMDRAEEFIRAYVTYNANIGNNANANFAALSKYIVPGSELYNRAYSSLMTGANWAGGDSFTYNSLEIDNFMPYGDKYFTCEISYNITNKTLYETREVVGDFTALFVLSDGEWRATRMI